MQGKPLLRRGSALLALALTLILTTVGCRSRTDKAEGNVVFSVSDFDGLPIAGSVNALRGGFLQVEEIELSNFPADPRGVTSDLMSIEIETYEVVYTRRDTGTRTPPTRVRSLFGLVPINGTTLIENLPVLGIEQIENPPLSDLLFENGSVDSETGSFLIVLDLQVTFRGKTLSGDSVITGLDAFSVEFVP